MASRPLLQTTLYITRCYRSKLQLVFTSPHSTSAPVAGSGRWQIVGAACITRPPVISPLMSPIEEKYSEMLAVVEKELSLKSDHEMQHEQDLIRANIMKSGDAEDIDLEGAAKQTALEFVDACEEELRAFKASLPDPDTYDTKDLSSLNRSLERSLVLVVKQKIGAKHEWVLPQTPWVPGETLRQTCERVIRESCGNDLKVKFLGNAPCGFYKYKYPKNVRADGFIGAKVFFFKGQVRDTKGSIQLGENVAEHQWLTQDELDNKFRHSYAKSVSQFLVSDQ